jgi:hypothetical protein
MTRSDQGTAEWRLNILKYNYGGVCTGAQGNQGDDPFDVRADYDNGDAVNTDLTMI